MDDWGNSKKKEEGTRDGFSGIKAWKEPPNNTLIKNCDSAVEGWRVSLWGALKKGKKPTNHTATKKAPINV